MVAGPDGTLHLFFPHQPEGQSSAIDYVTWDGNTWSDPSDIMLDMMGETPACVRAALDPRYNVHLVWLGANGTLQYASVPLNEARSAHAWPAPRVLTTAVGEADLIIGADGTIYLGYVAWPESGLVMLKRSLDGGRSWSPPTTVATTSGPDVVPSDVRLALSPSGTLHATWTEYALPDGWPPTASFYARSPNGGDTWAAPHKIAGASHGEVGVAAVDTQVHLVWRSTIGGDGTFHQYSEDQGITWQPPNRTADDGGFSGLPGTAVDHRGDVHTTIGSAFVMRWSNGAATPWLDVSGKKLRDGIDQPDYWTHPERAVIALTHGNQVHVVFQTGFKDLWHTSIQLNIPPEPTVSLEAQPAVPLSFTPTPVITSAEPLTSTAPLLFSTEQHATPERRHFGLLLGVGGAGLVTLVSLLFHQKVSRQP
jgi:hypothetical protein